MTNHQEQKEQDEQKVLKEKHHCKSIQIYRQNLS
jgi:hypothetical protein